MTITNYKIETSNSAIELENKVNEAIADSWQPLGIASVSTVTVQNIGITKSTLTVWYQTLVKYS